VLHKESQWFIDVITAKDLGTSLKLVIVRNVALIVAEIIPIPYTIALLLWLVQTATILTEHRVETCCLDTVVDGTGCQLVRNLPK